jgi:hypothetical protein
VIEHTPRGRSLTRTGSWTNNPSRSEGSPTPQPQTYQESLIGLAPQLLQVPSWNTPEQRSPLPTPFERPLGDNRRQPSSWNRRERSPLPTLIESPVGSNRRGASSSTSREQSSLPAQAGRLLEGAIRRVSSWNRSERSPLPNPTENRLGTRLWQSKRAQTDFQNRARKKENIPSLRAHSPLPLTSPTPPITCDHQEAEDIELRLFRIQQRRNRLEGPRPLPARPFNVREPVRVNRPIMTDNQGGLSRFWRRCPRAGKRGAVQD